MTRLTHRLAFIALAGIALVGCGGRGGAPTRLAPATMTTIGVNSYLWRAAIDTLSFAPLLSSDSSGGVIVTDWYSRPGNPGERVKLTVSILDQELRDRKSVV